MLASFSPWVCFFTRKSTLKRSTSSKLQLSAIAIAVTCALYGPSVAFAKSSSHNSSNLMNSSLLSLNNKPNTHKVSQSFEVQVPTSSPMSVINSNDTHMPLENISYNNVNSNSKAQSVNEVRIKRLSAVTNFANASYKLMVNNATTEQYLANEHLASSSTFPLRLINTIKKNPWQAAPFMPVQDKDLSCYYGIPSYKEPLNYDPNTTPVDISADEVIGSIDNKVSYKGDVTVTQGDKLIKADEAHYDGTKGSVEAQGNLLFQGPELTVNSQGQIKSDLVSQITTFSDATFQLNGSVARGSAQMITVNNEEKTSVIEDLSFSTCPIDDNSWKIKASRVELDQNESFGDAYGNVLYVKDVPVFYLPYVNFPITNERKSGLLYPNISISSENGFDYEQPIYFNLAPNYDYTLTPRLMTKRGLLLSNEFRYMPFADTKGQLAFDYIYDDNNWALADNFDKNYRYFLRWQHESYFFNKDLFLTIDYQKVRNNDYDYLDDIGAYGTNVTDDHLKQSFKIFYDRPAYNLSIEARDYQRLLPESLIYYRPFAMLPQIKAQYYDAYGPFTFDIQGNMTQFTSNSGTETSSRFQATRLHFEPDFGYQIFNNRGTSISANAKGFLTHYSQDSLDSMPSYYKDSLGFTSLADSTTRALYLLQFTGKTTLERKVLDLRHTQTLEPEIRYQYIPYEDQNDIALYDTTNRMSDYYSNFSSNHFTGYDRIADLNNITFGLTSRLLDAHDRELMRFGISQTYSFVPSRVTLNPNDPKNLYPRSPLSAFFNANPLPGLTTHASITYNNETNSVSAWNAMARYRNENGLLVQVSYRFADDGNRSFDNDIVDLSQLGLVTQIPLHDKLSLTLATYQDVKQDNNIDSKVALKYEECCWSVAFVYENYNSCDWDSLTQEKDHRVGIQFEFKGVGAVNVTGSADKNFTNTHLLNNFDPTNLSQ